MEKYLKDFRNTIFLVVILLLLIANYAVYSRYTSIKNEYDRRFGTSNVKKEETSTNSNTKDIDELEKLKDMEERDRMEFYFSKFIESIDEEDYQKAYDMLYPEFKDRYFPSIEKFIQYVKNTYPEDPGFVYSGIERQGDIYVLMVDIVNYNDKTKNKSQRIVIKENDFNDFVLSFQVI